MNFAFSDEQDMLRTAARDFLASAYPIDRVAALADGHGFDAAEWNLAADLGWTAISLPEDAGGAGMGFVEEAVVLEEAARTLYPGPLFATVALALPALAPEDAAAIISGERAATLAWAEEDGSFPDDGGATRADRRNGGARLTGRKLFVPNLGAASLVVVVAAGPALFAVDRDGDGVRWNEHDTVDRTRPLGELVLEEAPARPLAEGADAETLLARIRTRALAALAVEAVGVGQRALDLAVEHTRTREQFGRPVGSFQAVSHPLADSFMEMENARSLAYWAAWTVAEDDPEAARAAAAAKAYAAEAAVAACERAIQAQGGMGFTWESPMHRFYKRALWIAGYLGWPAEHRAVVAASLLD